MSMPLMAVDRLVLEATATRPARPVDDVEIAIDAAEIVGLVGESGSGKSLTAMAVAGLLPPGIRIRSGRIRFDGTDLGGLRERDRRALRGPGMALVSQEPMSAFNPVLTIGRQVTRVIRRHRRVSRLSARKKAADWLADVGIDVPASCMRMYPHELSGGMLQRVMLAMAASCRPRLLIADEPTAALDTMTQAALLRLLQNLRDDLGMAILLISHDLGVVGELCSRALVMHAGRIVEAAPAGTLLSEPAHPYTAAMLQALPVLGQRYSRSSEPPAAVECDAAPATACAFAPRCERASPQCRACVPALRPIREERQVACHHHLAIAGT